MAQRDTETLKFTLQRTMFYELWMLWETHARLGKPVTDVVIKNALIESFAIHARQLLEFFQNKQGIRANEFTGGSYEQQHIGKLDKKLVGKLNQQIAHITEGRTDDDSLKLGSSDRAKLLHAILKEAAHFTAKLGPEFKGLIAVEYSEAEKVEASPVAGATNHVDSVKVMIKNSDE